MLQSQCQTGTGALALCQLSPPWQFSLEAWKSLATKEEETFGVPKGDNQKHNGPWHGMVPVLSQPHPRAPSLEEPLAAVSLSKGNWCCWKFHWASAISSGAITHQQLAGCINAA